MPAHMTVQESHDIAIVLQHKVEGFDEVERAFVHGELPMAFRCCVRGYNLVHGWHEQPVQDQ